MGTWIEIDKLYEKECPELVVPYVGTWIEISIIVRRWRSCAVVPYVGTWLEITESKMETEPDCRRSLRGNVDRNISCVS